MFWKQIIILLSFILKKKIHVLDSLRFTFRRSKKNTFITIFDCIRLFLFKQCLVGHTGISVSLPLTFCYVILISQRRNASQTLPFPLWTREICNTCVNNVKMFDLTQNKVFQCSNLFLYLMATSRIKNHFVNTVQRFFFTSVQFQHDMVQVVILKSRVQQGPFTKHLK